MIFTMTYIGWENYNNIASIQKTQFSVKGWGLNDENQSMGCALPKEQVVF